MVKRNSNAIIAELLQLSVSPSKPTWLMYKSNVNWVQLRTYTELLMRQGLLSKFTVGNRAVETYFEITPKGEQYLRLYGELAKLTESIDQLHVELNIARTNERARVTDPRALVR